MKNYLNNFRNKLPNVQSMSTDLVEFEASKLRIGYAVLVHERFPYLQDTLDTLLSSHLDQFQIEIFLLDDGSEDPRVRSYLEYLGEHFPNVTAIFFEKTISTAGHVINRAINFMSSHGDFDIIGWSDPDCIYNKNWLKETLNSFYWLRHFSRERVLLFSSYNSRNQDFHHVISELESPFGTICSKKQMGMVNVFVFAEDLPTLGKLMETPDDETFLRLKMKQLGVPAYCTKTSWVEHIGQSSSLNAFRSTPMHRADSGLNLAANDWPKNLHKYKTLGQLREYIGDDSDPKTQESISVIIPCIRKDAHTLRLVIESLREFVQHPISDVYLIVDRIEDFLNFDDCILILESDVLPLEFAYPPNPWNLENRDGWLYQQMLKWASVLALPGERFFISDADTIWLRPVSFFAENTQNLFVDSEFHLPYQESIHRLLGYLPENPLSYVTHGQFIEKNRLLDLILEIESRFKTSWERGVFLSTDLTNSSGFSEYQTYGIWSSHKYPDLTKEFRIDNLIMNSLIDHEKGLKYYQKKYGNDFHTLSFHQWGEKLPKDIFNHDWS